MCICALRVMPPVCIAHRVTAVGDRYGASHNVGVGMPEVIARNWDDFVSVGQKCVLVAFCELKLGSVAKLTRVCESQACVQ